MNEVSTGGRFILLAFEDGQEEVQPREGTARGGAVEDDSGDDLQDYVKDEGEDNDY